MILFCFFSVSSEWLTGLTETGVQIAKMGHFMILVATFVDGEPRYCMPWSSGNETFLQFSNSKTNTGNETSRNIRWNYVTDSDELFDGVSDMVILASKSTEHEHFFGERNDDNIKIAVRSICWSTVCWGRGRGIPQRIRQGYVWQKNIIGEGRIWTKNDLIDWLSQKPTTKLVMKQFHFEIDLNNLNR